MTVIAYRDGILAADSLASAAGVVVPAPPKMARIDGLWAAAAGALEQWFAFKAWYARRGEPADYPKVDDDFCALVVGLRLVDCYGTYPDAVDYLGQPWVTIGAGMEIATAVLAQGGSAVDACRLACRLRTDCGPPVLWTEVGSDELHIAE